MKNLALFLLACIAVGCGDETSSASVLQQPPYQHLSDSIQQQPQNAQLYYRRGALLFQNDELPLAKKDLLNAWNLQPTEEHALSVVTVLVKTAPDSAIQFIQSALQQLPRSVALQIGLARGYQQKGDLDKALAACDQVLVLYPASLDAILLKAEIFKTQNKQSEAVAALEQAYHLAPSDQDLSYNLAFEYAQAQNANVLSLTDSLMKSDSAGKAPQPYYLRGVYYANTKNSAQALRFFNEAIARDYTFFDAYMDKGALLCDQKKYQEALQVFTLVNKISPTYADAYYWTGKCEEALNQKQSAKQDYQRAFSLDTSLHEAQDAAARL